MGGERFPKVERLRRRREFLHTQENGTKVSTPSLLGIATRSQRATTRIGFTVSSKVGNAVVRNRIRRRLREVYRKNRQALPGGLDIVLIARNAAAEADLDALARAFHDIARGLKRKL